MLFNGEGFDNLAETSFSSSQTVVILCEIKPLRYVLIVAADENEVDCFNRKSCFYNNEEIV